MKVKIFNNNYAHDLEAKINEFIEKIEKDHMKVVDIKLEKTPDGPTIYTALVMYKPDGILRLEEPWLM